MAVELPESKPNAPEVFKSGALPVIGRVPLFGLLNEKTFEELVEKLRSQAISSAKLVPMDKRIPLLKAKFLFMKTCKG